MWIAGAHVAVAAIIGGIQCFLIRRCLDFMRRSADAPASCAEGKARSEPDAQPVAAAEVSGSPASRSMAAIMPRGSWGTRASARAA